MEQERAALSDTDAAWGNYHYGVGISYRSPGKSVAGAFCVGLFLYALQSAGANLSALFHSLAAAVGGNHIVRRFPAVPFI